MKKLWVLVFLFASSVTLAGAVTLTWTPSTENTDGTPLTDLREYHLYYGTTQGGPYPNTEHTNDPNVSSWVVNDLAAGTYYFVATAINDASVESAFSNEAIKVVAGAAPNPPTNLVVDDVVAYSVFKLDNAFALVPIGTVPSDTVCDPTNGVNGHFVVPVDVVTFYNQASNPQVVVASCS